MTEACRAGSRTVSCDRRRRRSLVTKAPWSAPNDPCREVAARYRTGFAPQSGAFTASRLKVAGFPSPIARADGLRKHQAGCSMVRRGEAMRRCRHAWNSRCFPRPADRGGMEWAAVVLRRARGWAGRMDSLDRRTEAVQGRIWTCPDRSISGYPIALVLSCHHPRLHRSGVRARACEGSLAALNAGGVAPPSAQPHTRPCRALRLPDVRRTGRRHRHLDSRYT